MRAYDFRTVKGGRISVPGAYANVDIDHYHSGALCAGRSISGTSLVKAAKSPRHFWAHSAWNPNREPAEPRKALELGKAAHMMVFEPGEFITRTAVRPEEFPDFRTQAAQLWKEAQLAEGKVILTPEDVVTVERMAAAIQADADAMALFKDGLPELTFATKDEATGIWLLTRPDFTPASAARGLSDYKTAADAEPDNFSRDLFKHGYHIKAALALHVVAEVTGEKRPTYWLAAQEKAAPFVVQTFQLTEEQLELGRRRMRDALDRLAWCWDRHERGEPDAWPGYRTGPVEAVNSYAIRKELELLTGEAA